MRCADTAGAAEKDPDLEFEEFKDLLMHQRAIRLFDDRPVDDATIEQILRIATFRPTAATASRCVSSSSATAR